MSTGVRVGGFSIALALLLSACGGGDSIDTTTTADSTGSNSTETTTQGTPAAPATTAVADGAAPELGGTDWIVTEYLSQGSITTPWPDTELTLSFSTDGALSGSGGCNGYSATYTVSGPYDPFESGQRDPADGQEIVIDSLSFTERGCEPDYVMEQELEFFELLTVVARWVIVNDTNLSLRTADGLFLVAAQPSA